MFSTHQWYEHSNLLLKLINLLPLPVDGLQLLLLPFIARAILSLLLKMDRG